MGMSFAEMRTGGLTGPQAFVLGAFGGFAVLVVTGVTLRSRASKQAEARAEEVASELTGIRDEEGIHEEKDIDRIVEEERRRLRRRIGKAVQTKDREEAESQ